jgi:hypothetical protein
MRHLKKSEAAAVRTALPAMEELAHEHFAHAFEEWLAGRPDDALRARAVAIRDFCSLLASLATRAEHEAQEADRA